MDGCGDWLIVIGTSGLGLPIVNWLGVWVLGGLPVEWGEFPSCHGIWMLLWWALARTEALRSRLRSSGAKTRVQVDGFYALCGDVVPLFLLQVRFCRGGGVRGVGVGCRVTLVSSPLRRGLLITGVGLGSCPSWFLDCGLLVDDWASGGSILIIDEG